MCKKFDYDVCLSFASEQRDYVQQVYNELINNNVRVFYDQGNDIETMLWGRNLIEVFTDIYKKNARFCVMFLSKDYAHKAWTNLERRRALSRALMEDIYILPVRMDKTEIPGFDDSLGYLDATTKLPSEIAQQIILKLGRSITTITKEEAVQQLFNNIQAVLKKTNAIIVAIKGADNTIKLFSSQVAFEAEEYGVFIQFYKIDIVPYYKVLNIGLLPECNNILSENAIITLLEKVTINHG